MTKNRLVTTNIPLRGEILSAAHNRRHRHHPPSGRGGEQGPPCSGYGVEIVLATAGAVAAVCALALLFPPAIGREISFAAPYQPKPEWYFLWFYQAARYFPGAWAFWGLVVLPGLFFLGLLLVPGLDGNSGRGRALALGVCGLIALVFLGLTVLALVR